LHRVVRVVGDFDSPFWISEGNAVADAVVSSGSHTLFVDAD
jgi:hypothetical protein